MKVSIKYILNCIFSILFWKEYIYKHHKLCIIRLTNKTVRQQLKKPLTIPIVIISYNRLEYLEQLVSFLLERKHENIIIADNKSTYPPLLEYYNKIRDSVTIEYMAQNGGHLVFWEDIELFNKYSNGYYVVTDSDIVPNALLPNNYIDQMRDILDRNKDRTKVGFALDLDTIPDGYKAKEKVIDWEKQYWKNEIAENQYDANLDTTFAIYTPRYRYGRVDEQFFKAIRLAGNFTAKHGGWYIEEGKLSDEDKFYFNSVNNSSSWKLDDDGKFIGYKLY